MEPVDDPDLRVQWLLNGAPMGDSNRMKQIADFGWVILNISDCGVQDTGEWTCVAANSVGEAQVSASLSVTGKDGLLLDPINAQSLGRIQELEAPRPEPEEPAPVVYEAPQIATQLSAPSDVAEGDSVHLEAHYTPTNDPQLRVEWFKEGAPIFHSNRYKMVTDFGFAILDILYTLAHDSGEYTVRVTNQDGGEASSSTTLQVQKGDRLLLAPQREDKARAVAELEESLGRRPEAAELALEGRMPVFVQPLAGPADCVQGERAHFTARYEPKDDNQLRFFWTLNNRPLITGSRVKTITDFGYVVLEIFPVYPEDSGEYVCRAVNPQGEAVTTVSLQVIGLLITYRLNVYYDYTYSNYNPGPKCTLKYYTYFFIIVNYCYIIIIIIIFIINPPKMEDNYKDSILSKSIVNLIQPLLQCSPVDSIEHQSQLPQARQQATQQRIHEIETRRPELPETPEIVHGFFCFVKINSFSTSIFMS